MPRHAVRILVLHREDRLGTLLKKMVQRFGCQITVTAAGGRDYPDSDILPQDKQPPERRQLHLQRAGCRPPSHDLPHADNYKPTGQQPRVLLVTEACRLKDAQPGRCAPLPLPPQQLFDVVRYLLPACFA